MKFKVNLEIKGQNLLPLNYQYEVSSWLYKLMYADADFSKWLTEHGYMNDGIRFRLFTFSRLFPEKFRYVSDRVELQSRYAYLFVSLYTEEDIDPFIAKLFKNQHLEIGDKISKVRFHVLGIEKMPGIMFYPHMCFTTESPLVISVRDNESSYARFLSPKDPGYETYFICNLLKKHQTFMKHRRNTPQSLNLYDLENIRFKLLCEPRPKVRRIHTDTNGSTSVKGYLFDFELSAPPELICFGYYAGFGENTELGFGSVKKGVKDPSDIYFATN